MLQVAGCHAVVVAAEALVKNYGIKACKTDESIDNSAYPCAHASKDGRNKVELKKSNQSPVYCT